MPRVALAVWLSVATLLGVMLSAQDPPPAQGPGRGRGRGAGPGAPGGRGFGRGPSFDAAAIERAKPVFEAQCGFCHGNDARGRAGGPDLARSLVVLADTKGKELTEFLRVGRPPAMPAFPGLTDQQITDIAEFLHERLESAKSRTLSDATASLVGDAKAGEVYFNGAGRCASCHSITGDLAHIAAKYDPATLQDRMINPRPAGGRGGPAPSTPRSTRTVVVTLPSGQTVSGKLDFVSEFVVTLIDNNGARRTFTRNGDNPKVVVTDPLQAHIDMLRTLQDKDMHDLTAYLWTLK